MEEKARKAGPEKRKRGERSERDRQTDRDRQRGGGGGEKLKTIIHDEATQKVGYDFFNMAVCKTSA